MSKSAIYLTFLFLFLCGNASRVVLLAQDNNTIREEALNTRAFDEDVWQQLNEELDYSGEAPKPKEIKEKAPATNFEGFPTLSPILQVIIVIALIGLMAWFIYGVVSASDQSSFKRPQKTDLNQPKIISLERLEAELDKSDVHPLLFQAELDKDYYLAVRLHYLSLLKKLHTNKSIRWKKDLTNRAYLNQMRSHSAYTDFRALTLTFERVWYGHQVPDAEEYQEIRTAFYAFQPKGEVTNPVANG